MRYVNLLLTDTTALTFRRKDGTVRLMDRHQNGPLRFPLWATAALNKDQIGPDAAAVASPRLS